MSGWYRCKNISNAADAYDLLGVLPEPDGTNSMSRVMHLTMQHDHHVHSCYLRTLESVGKESQEAQLVVSAYQSLQGDARREYDRKLLAIASATRVQKYSICYVFAKF